MSDMRPIGILDGGIGGLTVCREISRLMPGERVVYFGNNVSFPLGRRPDDTIGTCAREGAEVLLENDIKMMVVACSTMSAVALDVVESVVRDIPVIGAVMPGARAAMLRTGNKKIGIIGTLASIRSDAYGRALRRIDKSVQDFQQATPLLSTLIEEMMLDHDITRLTAQFYLYEMIDLGVDCLILGSSCYTPLMEVIQGTVGTGMQLIDSSLWTAKEVQDLCTALDIRNDFPSDGTAESRFMLAEELPDAEKNISQFYGDTLQSVEIRKRGKAAQE